jgi:hypothetical protein
MGCFFSAETDNFDYINIAELLERGKKLKGSFVALKMKILYFIGVIKYSLHFL